MGQITKNQHYVPQFLLRGFAFNDSRVNVYELRNRRLRSDQPINGSFMQRYFYDTDNKVENYLNKFIESPASKIIKEILDGNFERINKNENILIKFISCQECRTPEAAKKALDCVNLHISEIMLDISASNNLNIDRSDFPEFDLSDKNAKRYFISERALSGVLNSKGLEDLRFHILVNDTDKEYLISDHPVTRYNWLYKNLDSPEISSLMASGVLMFLPISHRYCLCAYDPNVYKFGNRKDESTIVTNPKDIDWLNELQVRSAKEVVAFSSKSMKVEAERLATRFYNKKIYTSHSEKIGKYHNKNGDLTSRHIVYLKQTKLNRRPDFFKVLGKASGLGRSYNERNPVISAAVELLKSTFHKRSHNNR